MMALIPGVLPACSQAEQSDGHPAVKGKSDHPVFHQDFHKGVVRSVPVRVKFRNTRFDLRRKLVRPPSEEWFLLDHFPGQFIDGGAKLDWAALFQTLLEGGLQLVAGNGSEDYERRSSSHQAPYS